MPVFEVTEMSSATSSETSHDVLTQARKAGLARWKLETLTGLLGIRSMTHHQSETEKNQRAENAAVRRKLWGSQKNEGGGSEGDMAGSTILGDVTHPAPVIIAGGQQSSGLAKTLAGLAIGALIPTAGVGGFLASQLVDRVPALQPQQPSSTTVIQNTPEQADRVQMGLGKIEDYLKQTTEE
jgi:hypothetical protein